MINQAITIFLKELKCIVRDAKTFWVNILIPLLLVPTMLFIVNFSMSSFQSGATQNINIAINPKNNSFYKFMSSQDDITIVETSDPEKSLNTGEIDAYIKSEEDLDEKFIHKESFDFDIKYNDSLTNFITAKVLIPQYTEVYKSLSQNYNFSSVDDLNSKISQKLNLSASAEGVNIGEVMDSMNFSTMIFNMLVPMMIILYCCMGSSSTAIDLSAGEKERGTFEPLLSTGVERSAVILGKLLAVTVMGILNGVFTLIGLLFYSFVSSGNALDKFNFTSLMALSAVIMLVSVFFAALNLTIGVYSKSYKEAQTLLMPVYLLATLPSFFTLLLDAKSVTLVDLCIPILNIICIIKEILSGSFNFIHFSVVSVWYLLYIFILCFIMFKLFKKENIVFRI